MRLNLEDSFRGGGSGSGGVVGPALGGDQAPTRGKILSDLDKLAHKLSSAQNISQNGAVSTRAELGDLWPAAGCWRLAKNVKKQ